MKNNNGKNRSKENIFLSWVAFEKLSGIIRNKKKLINLKRKLHTFPVIMYILRRNTAVYKNRH